MKAELHIIDDPLPNSIYLVAEDGTAWRFVPGYVSKVTMSQELKLALGEVKKIMAAKLPDA